MNKFALVLKSLVLSLALSASALAAGKVNVNPTNRPIAIQQTTLHLIMKARSPGPFVFLMLKYVPIEPPISPRAPPAMPPINPVSMGCFSFCRTS